MTSKGKDKVNSPQNIFVRLFVCFWCNKVIEQKLKGYHSCHCKCWVSVSPCIWPIVRSLSNRSIPAKRRSFSSAWRNVNYCWLLASRIICTVIVCTTWYNKKEYFLPVKDLMYTAFEIPTSQQQEFGQVAGQEEVWRSSEPAIPVLLWLGQVDTPPVHTLARMQRDTHKVFG